MGIVLSSPSSPPTATPSCPHHDNTPTLQEAEEEELDIMDDALFLLSPDDETNAVSAKVGVTAAAPAIGIVPVAVLLFCCCFI